MTLYMHMIQVLGAFFEQNLVSIIKKKGYKENDSMWGQRKWQYVKPNKTSNTKIVQIKSENLAGNSKMIFFLYKLMEPWFPWSLTTLRLWSLNLFNKYCPFSSFRVLNLFCFSVLRRQYAYVILAKQSAFLFVFLLYRYSEI